MSEGEAYGPRTPPAIEQLQWSDEQATKRVTMKMEALINEFLGRVARFLGIHHRKGRPRPEFERAERKLDLMVKGAKNFGFNELASTLECLHLNILENYDKFALPIRHSLDSPGPSEEAVDVVPLSQADKDILDRIQGR